jgi:hypothetical protein
MVIIINKDENYHYLPLEIRTKIAESEDIDFGYAPIIANTSLSQHCDISFQVELDEYSSKYKIPRICDIILSTSATENRLYYSGRYFGTYAGNKFPPIPSAFLMRDLIIDVKELELIITGRILSHPERAKYLTQLDQGIDHLGDFDLKFTKGELNILTAK